MYGNNKCFTIKYRSKQVEETEKIKKTKNKATSNSYPFISYKKKTKNAHIKGKKKMECCSAL